ncbi:cache domain-containing protein [Sulfurimonas sp.]|uniref:sensor domain-containing diguanylate cyclase n=1 Tax=Sulfurimonas sp. TaxID=2022749 RepID=UPI003565D269
MAENNNKKYRFINEHNIVNLLAYGPFIFIPSVILLFSFLIINASNQSYEKNVAEIEKDLHNAYRKTIKSRVNSIVDYITYHKSITQDQMKYRIQKRVNNAIKIAKSLEKKYRASKSKKEIQELIIETLRPLTWNGGESFIWILDYKGVFYLAPEYLRHLEGSSIINFKDASGKEIIKEEIDICKNEGEGYLWDTFTRPNKGMNKQYHQLAYVKKFGLYDWYMGSSEYLDSASKRSDEMLIKSLYSIDKMSSNYIYIVNKNAEIIMHSTNSKLVGKNISNFSEDTNKVYLAIKDMFEDKKFGYVTYKWQNPASGNVEIKYAYAQQVPNSDWVVVSGYYESSIRKSAAEQSIVLDEAHDMKLNNIIYGSFALLFISLIISYLISNYVKKAFERHHKQINLKANELKNLNMSLELKVKDRTKQLVQITKELEKIAKTDYLTQAHNRYSIIKILDHEIKRAARNNTKLCLAMADVDWFKKINDEFGHDKGDSVLIRMVDIIKKNIREIDHIGRYGGEEFLLILPDTGMDDAKHSLERIMKNISEYNFEIDKQVTLSIGLVEFQNNESIDSLLKRADDLLYKSKENGRNLLSV